MNIATLIDCLTDAVHAATASIDVHVCAYEGSSTETIQYVDAKMLLLGLKHIARQEWEDTK